MGAPEPATEPLDHGDERLALAALLVRAARSDDVYDTAEAGRIDQILRDRFVLSAEAAVSLRVEAESLERVAPDTVRFTRAVKAAVAHEDRLHVIEALWRVVLEDGARAAEEDAFLRKCAALLGISDLERARARQRVVRGRQ